jgi:hypothetical protein
MNLLHSSAGLACAALSLLACGGAPAQPVGSAPAAAPLVGDAFFVARGASLGLSPEAARARDAGISESTPPEAAPDAMLAANAAAVWTSLCAQCTRFPPEPNGYLHIGPRQVDLPGLRPRAANSAGLTNLRIDDTNPTTEEVEYVESIQRDVRGWASTGTSAYYFGLDFFGQMYLPGAKT